MEFYYSKQEDALITFSIGISSSEYENNPDYENSTKKLFDFIDDSGMLWDQLSALYGICSVVCVTCVSIYVSESKTNTKLFRVGIYLFTAMNWLSKVGYDMFPLSDSGKEISTFQETMHIAVTAAVVLLSIVLLAILIIAGFKKTGIKSIAVWSCIALAIACNSWIYCF